MITTVKELAEALDAHMALEKELKSVPMGVKKEFCRMFGLTPTKTRKKVEWTQERRDAQSQRMKSRWEQKPGKMFYSKG